MTKRQKTEHTSTVVNNQKAIDAHKAKMEAKGWNFERSWCYEGVTSHINLVYKKQRTASEPEPKVNWHRLDLKAESFGGANDGAKNFMGGDYAVHAAVQEISCDTCHKPIIAGDHFTIRGKPKPLPVCRECCPFLELDPSTRIEHVVLSGEEIKRGLDLAGQEED
jgi:hypothetical protein